MGHPQPSEAPGEVRQAGLNLGPGKGGGEVGIEALGGDLGEAANRDAGEGKDLSEKHGEVPIHRRNGLRVEASTKLRQKRPQSETDPVGQAAGRAPPPSKAVASLLGQERLGPGGDGGQAEAALREGNVELVKGKALEATSPQEVAHRTAEASGGGGGEGKDLGKVPGLGNLYVEFTTL